MTPSPQPLLLLYAAGIVESFNRALIEHVSLFQRMCLSCGSTEKVEELVYEDERV